MNAMFLSSRAINEATVEASSEQGLLVASNVQTIDPTEVWRATGCASEWIRWSMASAVIVNAIVANAVNWSPTAMIRLRLATTENNVTAAPDFDSGWVSPWPGDVPADWLYKLAFLMVNNPDAFAFGRLDIEDPDNPDGYVEIGRLFADEGFVPTMNVDMNPTIGLVSSDEVGRTPFNHTIGDDRGPASRLMSVPMSAINDEEMRDELFELQRYCGLAKDFAFCLDPAATNSFYLYAMQARFAALSGFQYQLYFSDVSQLWNTTLNLEEIN